jgi:hypothetical protein
MARDGLENKEAQFWVKDDLESRASVWVQDESDNDLLHASTPLFTE